MNERDVQQSFGSRAECPACGRRLVLQAVLQGTFKAACAHRGCGAELLCHVDDVGALRVEGPRALYEEEGRRTLALRAATSSRSFWASTSFAVIALGAFVIYVLPLAFAAGGTLIGLAAMTLGVVLTGLVMTGAWLYARATTEPAEPLRAAEGAFRVWEEAQGFRSPG